MLVALCLALVPQSLWAASLRIGVIGDSTLNPGLPARGWAQMLGERLNPDVAVINEAQSGASTKTFPAYRWQRMLNQKPDFVFIQFGHNDSHAKGNPESTDAATGFRDNLRQLVQGARNAGAVVVLVTPVRRRVFKDGRLSTELAPYAEAVRALASELKVPVLDLHELSGALFERLGEEGSSAFTLNKRDDADRPGLDDRTHFTEEGARQIAALVVDEFKKLDPRLAKAVRQ